MVDSLLGFGQQIEKQCRKTRLLQHASYILVPRAEPAASAAVRKQDQPLDLIRNPEISFEPRPLGRNFYCANPLFILRRHASVPPSLIPSTAIFFRLVVSNPVRSKNDLHGVALPFRHLPFETVGIAIPTESK